MSLTLSSSSLHALLPLPQAEVEPTFEDHDLLTGLSEGPVYPDESAAERAARQEASLTRLPLSRIDEGVLNTKLVTPRQGARVLKERLAMSLKLPPLPDAIGDDYEEEMQDVRLGAKDSMGSEQAGSSQGDQDSGGSSTPRSSISSRPGTARDSIISTASAVSGRGRSVSGVSGQTQRSSKISPLSNVSEELKTLTRSARHHLEVRNAVSLRMRTVLAPKLPSSTSTGEEDDDDSVVEEKQQRSMVLCVEIENAQTSGMRFEVRDVEVIIRDANQNAVATSTVFREQQGTEFPGASARRKKGSSTGPVGGSVKAVLLRDGETTATSASGIDSQPLAFLLEQGEQRNLLYYITYEPHDLGNPNAIPNLREVLRETQKLVSIKVHGRPILLTAAKAPRGGSVKGSEINGSASRESSNDSEDESEATEESTPCEVFPSIWTCSLDLSTLRDALDRRSAASRAAILAGGSTSVNFGRARSSIAGSALHTAEALRAAAAEDSARQRMASSSFTAAQIGGGGVSIRVPSTSPMPAKWTSSASLATPISGPNRGIGLGVPANALSPISGPGQAQNRPSILRSASNITINTPISESGSEWQPRARSPSIVPLSGRNMSFGPGRIPGGSLSFPSGVAGGEMAHFGSAVAQNPYPTAFGEVAPSARRNSSFLAVAKARAAGLAQQQQLANNPSLSLISENATSANDRKQSVALAPSVDLLRAGADGTKGLLGGAAIGSAAGGRATAHNLFTAVNWAGGHESSARPRSGSRIEVRPFEASPNIQTLSAGGATATVGGLSAQSDGEPHGSLLLVTQVNAKRAHSRRTDRDDGHQQDAEKASGATKKTSEPQREFEVQIWISNRGTEVRNLVLSWETDDGRFSSNEQASGSGSSSDLERANLLKLADQSDPTAYERAILKLYERRRAEGRLSCLIPVENHIIVGPIFPSTLEMAHLPLIALAPGTHSLPPLVVSDADTGAQRFLRDVGSIVMV